MLNKCYNTITGINPYYACMYAYLPARGHAHGARVLVHSHFRALICLCLESYLECIFMCKL